MIYVIDDPWTEFSYDSLSRIKLGDIINYLGHAYVVVSIKWSCNFGDMELPKIFVNDNSIYFCVYSRLIYDTINQNRFYRLIKVRKE